MQIDLPYGLVLRDYQKLLWNAVMNKEFQRGIVVWPRRNGKDLICWNTLIAKAMEVVGLYFYMAPYYNQVRQIIWQGGDGGGRRFIDYIPPQLVKSRTKIDMRVELINGSQIKLQGSDNIDSIVGTNPRGIVFTEFSLHKPEAWHYLRPILAENNGWALFNGTPRGLNHFYQLFHRVKSNPDWFVQYLTREDTGIPTDAAIAADVASGMPQSLVEQEYMCSWTSSSEETLIPLDILEPAINREVNTEHVQSQPRVMGVDVAFAEKGDLATIAQRQGTLLHPLEKYQGKDNMAFASRISVLIKEWKPHVVFIDAGRGEGVISRLYQLGHRDVVVPIHFGGKTFSELYGKKRDEMWCECKVWIADVDNLASIPDDQQLIEELASPTFGLNDKNFVVVETKQHLRSRGVKSTDCADAVILTFAEDVGEPYLTDNMIKHGITPEILEQLSRADQGTRDYDPLGYMDQYSGSEGAFYGN